MDSLRLALLASVLWSPSVLALDPACADRYALLSEAKARRAGVSPADYQAHQRELRELETLRARANAPRDFTARQKHFQSTLASYEEASAEAKNAAIAYQNKLDEFIANGKSWAEAKADPSVQALEQSSQELKQKKHALSEQINTMRAEGRGVYEPQESAAVIAYRERVQASPAYVKALEKEDHALKLAEAQADKANALKAEFDRLNPSGNFESPGARELFGRYMAENNQADDMYDALERMKAERTLLEKPSTAVSSWLLPPRPTLAGSPTASVETIQYERKLEDLQKSRAQAQAALALTPMQVRFQEVVALQEKLSAQARGVEDQIVALERAAEAAGKEVNTADRAYKALDTQASALSRHLERINARAREMGWDEKTLYNPTESLAQRAYREQVQNGSDYQQLLLGQDAIRRRQTTYLDRESDLRLRVEASASASPRLQAEITELRRLRRALHDDYNRLEERRRSMVNSNVDPTTWLRRPAQQP